MSDWVWPYGPVLWSLVLVGATSGALGCFAVLRRQSLLSDTLAHAALPGVCLAYLFTGRKDTGTLLLGALAAGLLGVLWLQAVLQTSRLKADAAQGIVLVTFFSVGVVLLSLLQNRADARQAGLDHFLYGQAAYLTAEHLRLLLPLGAAVLLTVAVLFKELGLLAFDPEFAQALGRPRRALELCLALLLALTVMISLRAVGVVLTVALLVSPAAAARQWTNRLGTMVLLAMALGIVAAVGGTAWSTNVSDTPTGPAVVLVAAALLGVSLLLAPGRGWLWRRLRAWRHRRAVRRENLLADLYRLGEAGATWDEGRTAGAVAAVRHQAPGPTGRTLADLAARGLVEPRGGGWRLTGRGRAEAARVIRTHRLWELYLARRMDLPADHVHRDAEAMEHALPPELVAELEAHLDHPTVDPHGHPIPQEGRP